MVRLRYYAGASAAAAAACLLKAFHQRPNYYSATVYLSQSNACLLILTNLVLVVVCSFIYALQRLLYGPLRPIEIEQLSDKAWYAVLDTLLAMPSFREDLSGALLAMFTLLLAGKVWGWIGEGRVDILEQQPPANPRLFHLRLATSLILSVVFDFYMMDYCIETVLADPRPGMMVIFTFEFAILGIFSLFTLARYCLSVLQIRIEKRQLEKAIEERKMEIKEERAAARRHEAADGSTASVTPQPEEPIEVDENEVNVPGWEEKRRHLFILEVFTDLIKLIIYIVFFLVSVTFNGLPMHIMRDVYMTFASFTKRVSDFIAYRKATSDMNTRYPDATTEEIRDDSCIVCRETMVAWTEPNAQPAAQADGRQPASGAAGAAASARPKDEGLRAKKLPCGHILHLRCLRAWLERQQVCPTCRRPVITAEQATQTTQGGAPGANPQQPGQQAQQPARRQGRARIFNFGPVRIGFLNGPGDQINNIVRQIENPVGVGQNGQQQNQHQQNHAESLGSQGVGQQHGQFNINGATAAGSRANTSIRTQILEMQLRLLEEGHNLHVEREQLALLNRMHMEMLRLRSLAVGQGLSADAQGGSQLQQLHPSSPLASLPMALVGGRAITSGTDDAGSSNLPPGMVLPSGWTITPLRRSTAQTPRFSNLSPALGRSQTGVIQISSVTRGNINGFMGAPNTNGFMGLPGANGLMGMPPMVGFPGIPSRNPAAGTQAPNPTITIQGPTDDAGEPWFVPGNEAPNGPASTDERPQASATATATTESGNGTSSQGASPDRSATAMTPADERAVSDARPATNGHVDGPASSEESTPRDKGKGRAVEVEDAPDSGT